MLSEKVSMRRPGYIGRPVMYILQTLVVCVVVCMCLSSTVGTGWWSERRRRMTEELRGGRYRGPVALHHEQTVAVVTHNGPENTIDRLVRIYEGTHIYILQMSPNSSREQ